MMHVQKNQETCILIKVKRGVELTLSKSKDGALNVKSIDVYTKNPNKNITDLERFQCGGFDIGGAKLTKETKQCKTGQFFLNL